VKLWRVRDPLGGGSVCLRIRGFGCQFAYRPPGWFVIYLTWRRHA